MGKFITIIFCLLAIIFVGCGCGDEAQPIPVNPIAQSTRSADPLKKWQAWSSGPAALVTPELRDGNASHNLSPAELIYYSAKENNVNPVILLALLENQQLLTVGQLQNDFEMRLYSACNYELDGGKYYGFFPQMVASTYQLWLDESNGLNFAQSYNNNFATEMDLSLFMTYYLDTAQMMNVIAGVNYPAPDPNGTVIFHDYAEISISNIQTFLNQCPNTALKRTTLFQETVPSNSANVEK